MPVVFLSLSVFMEQLPPVDWILRSFFHDVGRQL
jgi:hypothetical protein